VLPDQVAVSKAHEAFDENGRLKDAGLTDAVQNLGRTLAGVIAKLNA
jgi:hypothetical protein